MSSRPHQPKTQILNPVQSDLITLTFSDMMALCSRAKCTWQLLSRKETEDFVNYISDSVQILENDSLNARLALIGELS